MVIELVVFFFVVTTKLLTFNFSELCVFFAFVVLYTELDVFSSF